MCVTPFLLLNAHAYHAGNYKMCICVESSTICCVYNSGNFMGKLWIKIKKNYNYNCLCDAGMNRYAI